ncbi:MAG: hypothetical protein L0I76_27380 [Pseudonocardia sp.]|nr:hypothetical protein [Pseudonocardia sp.]
MTRAVPEGRRRGRAPVRALLRRWPTVVGLLAALAAFLGGADRTTLGIAVAIAATCYLAASALERPWAAWAAIPGCGLAVVVGRLLGADPLTTLAVIAVALVVVGLITRASRAALSAEATALLAYGGLTVIALAIAPTVGLVLVAVTLIAHAVWDVVHLRRRVVVPPSLAEICIALDVSLGLTVLLGLLLT